MKVRRFFAKDMRTVLGQVTQELGEDAAILQTNQLDKGVEVIAASDYNEEDFHALHLTLPEQKNRIPYAESSKPLFSVEQEQESSHRLKSKKETVTDNLSLKRQDDSLLFSAQNTTQNKTQNTTQNTKVDMKNEKSLYDDFPSFGLEATQPLGNEMVDVKHQDETFDWVKDPAIIAMKEELYLLRQLLQSQVSELAWHKKCANTPVSASLEKHLRRQGLSRSVVQGLISQVKQTDSLEQGWQYTLGLLAKQIHTTQDCILDQSGYVALLGASGVGKTTTIAKLAANYALKHGRKSLGIISMDSYRIAAHEQMKVYGRILQVPVQIVSDNASLKKALNYFSDKKMVFIDTAGASHHDEDFKQQMQMLETELASSIRRYLVLSATSQYQVLDETIRRFASMDIHACIMTKLDEATSLGEILSILYQQSMSIAYVTYGQKVPETIKAAHAHHLVSKMVSLSKQFGETLYDEYRLPCIGDS